VAHPLYVAFVWHLHQPFYKDIDSGRYFLPWVRLHAVKDYLHLAEVIRDYPRVHQTINTVPSLLVQLEEYATGQAVDPFLAVSEKKELGPDDRRFILRNFFSINWDRFVWPVPRYAQLARLREAAGDDAELFSETFWTDLIAWFNLAWIDPGARQRDARLRALVEKGQEFDRSDIATILAYHREVCGQIIPTYRKLAEQGQIELSTSPFFHPILPLLIDSRVAREAHPDVALPRLRIAYPDDAAEQMQRAIAHHQRVFGRSPAGLWPPEGAVSPELIALLARMGGIRWIATDEHLLARALHTSFSRDGAGHLTAPGVLYRPYRVDGSEIAVFFRDQVLSDRIGFVYQNMDSVRAADDLIERLLHAWQILQSDEEPHVVSIILDGENCWETYPNNGDDFLRRLFERLSNEERLAPITPAEFLDRFGVRATLDHLPAGSWIGGTFDTWIGEPDQNHAWELLAVARSRLAARERALAGHDDLTAEALQRARLAVLVAEGSDWFWWYFSRNRPRGENPFDVAFRGHLANVYRALGEPVPSWLNQPVSGRSMPRQKEISGPVTITVLSSESTAGGEWANAGFVEPETSTGAMQHGVAYFRRMFYGYDAAYLYFRIELEGPIGDDVIRLLITAERPASPDVSASQAGREATWEINLRDRLALPVSKTVGTASQASHPVPIEAAAGDRAVELRVNRSALGLVGGSILRLQASAWRGDHLIESLPRTDAVIFHLAAPHGAAGAGEVIEGEHHAQSQADS
jgi:alpha-amylase/alpha-mannosidase (GH57 family)